MGLASKGHSVTVVTSSRGKDPGTYFEEMGPLRVIRYPETRYLFEAPMLPKVALAALKEDYDILHVHGMTPSVTELAIVLAKLRRKKVVLTYHNDAQTTFHGLMGALAGAVYSKLVIPVVRMADEIVSTTYSYAATSPVLKHLMRAVTIIPWGADSVRPAAPESQPGDGQKHVLFVGQLKVYKGLHVLLDSLAKLNGRGHAISLDIVGTGPSASDLRSMSRELKLEDRVKFWGGVPDEKLTELYQMCDLVTLPSLNRREAFGLAMLDAFAAGKPVVTTDIPGVKEVAKLGECYMVKPNDPGSLSEAILEAAFPRIGRDPKSKPLSEDFSWSSVVVKYEDLLRGCSGVSLPAYPLR